VTDRILTPLERRTLADLVARERDRRRKEAEAKAKAERLREGWITKPEALLILRSLCPLRDQIRQLRATFSYCEGEDCGRPFDPGRSDQRYCSHTCYHRNYRRIRQKRKAYDEIPHGWRSSYVNYGCRCADCTAAALEYNRQRRQAA
jgi:hypothetical protein